MRCALRILPQGAASATGPPQRPSRDATEESRRQLETTGWESASGEHTHTLVTHTEKAQKRSARGVCGEREKVPIEKGLRRGEEDAVTKRRRSSRGDKSTKGRNGEGRAAWDRTRGAVRGGADGGRSRWGEEGGEERGEERRGLDDEDRQRRRGEVWLTKG